MCARVERWLTVHQKVVEVVAVVEGHLCGPRAIGLTVHGIGFWSPAVEFAHQGDVTGRWSKAEEINRFGHPFGGVAMQAAARRDVQMRVQGVVQVLLGQGVSQRPSRKKQNLCPD